MFDRLKLPARVLTSVGPIFLSVILINLSCSAFFSFYWLKDNPSSLDPRWISQANYQAIQTSTASSFETSDGLKIQLPADPLGRSKVASTYQLTTPDGRWRGSIAPDLSRYTMMAWLNAAVPVISLCVVGLYFTWRGPSSAKIDVSELSLPPLTQLPTL